MNKWNDILASYTSEDMDQMKYSWTKSGEHKLALPCPGLWLRPQQQWKKMIFSMVNPVEMAALIFKVYVEGFCRETTELITI